MICHFDGIFRERSVSANQAGAAQQRATVNFNQFFMVFVLKQRHYSHQAHHGLACSANTPVYPCLLSGWTIKEIARL
jgi:hypothetical protein